MIKAALKWLDANCVATGSRRFGVGREDSDYDYICTPDQLREFVELFTDAQSLCPHDYGEGVDSYKFTFGACTVDMLVTRNDAHFEAWVRTTNEVAKLSPEVLRSPGARHDIFEIILAVFLPRAQRVSDADVPF